MNMMAGASAVILITVDYESHSQRIVKEKLELGSLMTLRSTPPTPDQLLLIVFT
jgi:hypothetical protein